jgi:glutathione S-transferase
MTLKLYGPQYSTNTSRVVLIAKECNIPYERVHVDLAKEEHKQPGHLEHQPFGQVPYVIVRCLSLSFYLIVPKSYAVFS